MRDVLVALDLETTGLNPTYDEIIEIGAVKFLDGEVIEEWQSLVYPGRSVPAYVTQLTGITDDELTGAPRLEAVLPSLRTFIGQAPIVGHNVSFDLTFLRQAGVARDNEGIDTYLLASVMLPSTPRYNLSALAAQMAIPNPGAHRALADAWMTMGLYTHLWELVLDLPLDVLAEIVRLGKQVEWGGELVFEAALAQRNGDVVPPLSNRLPDDVADTDLDAAVGKRAALSPTMQVRPIDIDAMASLLEPGGALAGALGDYEYRQEQVTMAREVGRAFNEGLHVLIEAPTGVGKSLAYLLPAALFAVKNDDRVVISTNTINLQEQLINKDIPLLIEALGLPVRHAVLKGRRNYLCPRRLLALRRRGPTSAEEMHLLAKVLAWQSMNGSGDRGEISLRGPIEAAIWRRLSAEDEGCTMERCMTQMGGACPFYKARRRAETAHLLIVNHALLLSDVATEGRVLPDYRYVVVDEAHHLEDAVTGSMTFRTDPETIQRQVSELGTVRSGLMGELLRRTEGNIPDSYHETLTEFVETISDAARSMTHHVDAFFRTLRGFLEDHTRVAQSEYITQIRIVDALRKQPAWSGVEIRWDNLSQFTGTIAEALGRLAQGLGDLYEYDIEDFDDLVAATGAMARHIAVLHERLDEMVIDPDANTVYWVEFYPDGGRISINAAPLDVGPLVSEHLWMKKDTVVMTSATLRTDETFDFVRRQLQADHADELIVDTPFDYESNTLLYLVRDIPEPRERQAYQQAVERGLVDLCRVTEGRTLVLFTSYAQLRTTANAISDELAQDGIVVYDQSDGSSRSQLLEGFVDSEKAVLLGTRSFWEGVDVPGQDLSVLVIVRLPFSVPSDPLFAARSERFDNPFQQYAIPETILRFRQGFGRLIRRKSDRGVVAIFDSRVISKGYGRQFLNALPHCTTRQGRLSDLPTAAAEWLSKEG